MKIWRFFSSLMKMLSKISASTKSKELTKRFSSFIILALYYENNIMLEDYKRTFFLFLKLLFRHSFLIYFYSLHCFALQKWALVWTWCCCCEFSHFVGNGSTIQSFSQGSIRIIYTVTLLSHTEALYNDSFFIILG